MFSFSKPLALFPYKEFMLTKSEIRLLEYAESLDDKRKKLEDEKRHERLILEQSLQMSSLSGIQLQMETKKEPKEVITSSSTLPEGSKDKEVSITSDDFAKLQGSSDVSMSQDLTEKSTSISSAKTLKANKTTTSKLAPSSSSSSGILSTSASPSAYNDESMQIDDDGPISQTSFASQNLLSQLSTTPATSAPQSVVDTTTTGGISRIKKKQKVSATDGIDTTATASISTATDSSGRLSFNLQRDGLDSIFTPEGLLSHFDWSPSATNLEPISFKLTNFTTSTNSSVTHFSSATGAGTSSITGNQTLALKMTVTPSKGRWSVNFCPEDPKDYADILLHFNPRYSTGSGSSSGSKNEQLVMNDLQGTWGKPIKKILHNTMRTSSLNLIFQIRLEGFYIFANGIFSSFFAHRRDPMAFNYSTFTLQFPATDSMGNLENLTLHKVWWGRIEENVFSVPSLKQLLQTAEQENGNNNTVAIGKNNYFENLWLRTICVEGLPPESDPTEVYELEKALYQLFMDYVPEAVYIVDGKGRAYVRLEDSSNIEPAIQELNNSVLADTFTLIMSPATS